MDKEYLETSIADLKTIHEDLGVIIDNLPNLRNEDDTLIGELKHYIKIMKRRMKL